MMEKLIYLVAGMMVTVSGQYIKKLLDNFLSKNKVKEEQERISFESLLEYRHKLFKLKFIDRKFWSDELMIEHLDTARRLIVWSKDDVLSEYGKYFELLCKNGFDDVTENDIQFANTVLAFRKQIGYKNKKITPKQIALIFKGGWKDSKI